MLETALVLVGAAIYVFLVGWFYWFALRRKPVLVVVLGIVIPCVLFLYTHIYYSEPTPGLPPPVGFLEHAVHWLGYSFPFVILGVISAGLALIPIRRRSHSAHLDASDRYRPC